MAALRKILDKRRRQKQDRDNMAVLGCLLTGDRYVVAIWRRLSISSGRVYLALARLERQGLVSSGPPRRVYTLKPPQPTDRQKD